MNKLSFILLNPFFIGLPISFIIILLLPHLFDKYKTELVYKKYLYESKVYFHDLNNDSYSEMIRLHYSGNNRFSDSMYIAPAIQIDSDYSVEKLPITVGQFNFNNKWFKIQQLYFGDFDNDGLKEIYFYTYRGDSLFFQSLDVFNRKEYFIETFICKFNYRNKFTDMLFGKICVDYDFNDDGSNEVIGTVIGAYSALPRFVFVYDIINDILYSSKTASINFNITDVVRDINNKIYITGNVSAPGNVKDSILSKIYFTDHSSWLVVLDKHLDFVFPPIENAGFTSSVNSYIKWEGGEVFLYTFFRPTRGKNPQLLRKFNLNGIEIFSKKFIDPIERVLISKFENNNKVLYIFERRSKTLYQVNENLNFTKTKKIKYRNIKLFDMDFDGSEEIFNFQEGEDYAYIYTSDIADPAKVEIKDLSGSFILSPCRFKDNSANFAIYSDDFVCFFKYFKNPFYYLKIPFFLGIYLLISFLFYIVMYLQRKSLQQRYKQEQKMTELELLTIKNQMDPHFTFNAINTASLVVYNEDKKTAYKFLVDFSNLIRNTLKNSKEISVPLKDEIEFVRNYLGLQQFRHDFLFDYKIDVSGDIDQNQEVPKMIIQTFAENAIKHGLVYKKEKGKLDIVIRSVVETNTMNRNRGMNNSAGLIIEITDNGIGRKKAAEIKKKQKISTGKGHDIINQIIAMYNKLKNTKVNYEIKDLYNNGKAVGTKVIVNIPVNHL